MITDKVVTDKVATLGEKGRMKRVPSGATAMVDLRPPGLRSSAKAGLTGRRPRVQDGPALRSRRAGSSRSWAGSGPARVGAERAAGCETDGGLSGGMLSDH